jgi:beta-lactam-binding protein with PASTA domain
VPNGPPTATIANGGGVLVPHLVGVHRAQAEQLLENRGLYVRVDPRGTANTNTVVGQRPRPDVRIAAPLSRS